MRQGSDTWYVLHPGPPASGAFGCWKRGVKETWCEKLPREYTTVQWREIQARWKEADIEREQVERIRREQVQKTGEWIIKRANRVSSHPYLEQKAVKPYGTLLEYRGLWHCRSGMPTANCIRFNLFRQTGQNAFSLAAASRVAFTRWPRG